MSESQHKRDQQTNPRISQIIKVTPFCINIQNPKCRFIKKKLKRKKKQNFGNVTIDLSIKAMRELTETKRSLCNKRNQTQKERKKKLP